ncbi:flagellar biosynthetic protein FlhB [Motilibacter rhizosphaerae]|uniref:Flagellar biosynthetic protein FlhB n=1 Tax=Motilibacter rhizosphaerae TaxID=598652 RepID=A0A4Q7NYG9_9ACTN|nr:EscU/YscU/HrcU family type III secretion system export apparatus switch protein [Motilibacter rhizosphaerae]RZS91442.1 flagellar biosynthetic protein FlhB [Motilibacter rhizosphaerae]
MSGEKTEKPTAKRVKEAQREGRTPKTPDFAGWIGLLSASFVIPATAGHATNVARQTLLQSVDIIADPDPQRAAMLFVHGIESGVALVIPMAIVMIVIGSVSSIAQGGLHIATHKLKPSFKSLNVLAGLKRLVGPHGAWEAVKSLLKLTFLGFVVWHAVAGVRPLLAYGTALPLSAVLATVGRTTLEAMREGACAGLLIAAADYGWVRRQYSNKMKMSKQEIKEEGRAAEGDPAVKGKRKSKQFELARQRMMNAVPQADVVIVNPTHVAVALRYDAAQGAPRVVAKGSGHVAKRIRELAQEHRVPMVQDIPLARAIYASAEVGDEIPPELYTAVARVLAFVLSLRARGSAAGTHKLPALAQRR